DLAPVIVHETALAPGVTAYAGARITGRAGARITVAGDGLVANGAAPADATGDVWSVAPVTDPPRTTMMMFEGDQIRGAKDAGAPVIAQATARVDAHELAVDGAWTEVIAGGDLLRVHGFIPTPPPGDYGGGFGSGHGTRGGEGVPVVVPTSACLYDRAGGDVI